MSNHTTTPNTVQSRPIPGSSQVRNSAGGFSWAVDDWTRLDRFLILGCEGPTYYASQRKQTSENAESVLRCLSNDPRRTVGRIVAISEEGRAPKNDPAIFALAMSAAFGDVASRALALEALPRVCRIGTHLFQFAERVKSLRGWGRSLRRAVARWYTEKKPRDLAYQCVKYQQRNNWTHRDLLRLAHPKAEGTLQDVLRWIVSNEPFPDDTPSTQPDLTPIWAAEQAKRASEVAEVVRLIREYGLVRECIPTQWLTEASVWEALLEKMPLTALIRNLATMTRVGLLAANSEGMHRAVEMLSDRERLRKARVHPIAALAALKTYEAGHGVRGKHTWTPVPLVVKALESAFYAAFDNVEPTGKSWMLSLDVSGSMEWGTIAGVSGLTPRVASAALAMVTARIEPNHCITAFSHQLVPVDIGPGQNLAGVLRKTGSIPMGGTDCSLPMLQALKQKREVDVFVVLTDSETWAGKIHPVEALQRYRDKMGIPAKLIVCGMVSNGFTIADPNDSGMLDVVGFDTATPQLMADFGA